MKREISVSYSRTVNLEKLEMGISKELGEGESQEGALKTEYKILKRIVLRKHGHYILL